MYVALVPLSCATVIELFFCVDFNILSAPKGEIIFRHMGHTEKFQCISILCLQNL